MTRYYTGILLAVSAMLGSLIGISCGARLDTDAVTETGNPSLINDTRITATPLDGVIFVEGTEGSVPSGAKVTIINETGDESSEGSANPDGSFALSVEGSVGDTLAVVVESDGQSESKRVAVTELNSTPAPAVTVAPITTVPLRHRPAPETCGGERPPGNVEDRTPPLEGDDLQCTNDADCTEGTNGRCNMDRSPGCSYDTCTNDSQCPAGPCGCDVGYFGADQCFEGNCRIDSDCGAGGYCSPSVDSCGPRFGFRGYWCHTPEDECANDTDCGVNASEVDGFCFYSPEATRWLCAFTQCPG